LFFLLQTPHFKSVLFPLLNTMSRYLFPLLNITPRYPLFTPTKRLSSPLISLRHIFPLHPYIFALFFTSSLLFYTPPPHHVKQLFVTYTKHHRSSQYLYLSFLNKSHHFPPRHSMKQLDTIYPEPHATKQNNTLTSYFFIIPYPSFSTHYTSNTVPHAT